MALVVLVIHQALLQVRVIMAVTEWKTLQTLYHVLAVAVLVQLVLEE
jgi:hypothetical protein